MNVVLGSFFALAAVFASAFQPHLVPSQPGGSEELLSGRL